MINTAGNSGAAATNQADEENKENKEEAAGGDKDENDYEQEAHNYLSLAL